MVGEESGGKSVVVVSLRYMCKFFWCFITEFASVGDTIFRQEGTIEDYRCARV